LTFVFVLMTNLFQKKPFSFSKKFIYKKKCIQPQAIYTPGSCVIIFFD